MSIMEQNTDNVFNFSAGPAGLPKAVMQQAQQELIDWQGLGTSVMEISHRSKEFIKVAGTEMGYSQYCAMRDKVNEHFGVKE